MANITLDPIGGEEQQLPDAFNIKIDGRLVGQYYANTARVCPIRQISDVDLAAIEKLCDGATISKPPPEIPEDLQT